MALIQILPSVIKVQIEFPALDRLIEFLQSDQQKQVDDIVDQLGQSEKDLQGSIDRS